MDDEAFGYLTLDPEPRRAPQSSGVAAPLLRVPIKGRADYILWGPATRPPDRHLVCELHPCPGNESPGFRTWLRGKDRVRWLVTVPCARPPRGFPPGLVPDGCVTPFPQFDGLAEPGAASDCPAH